MEDVKHALLNENVLMNTNQRSAVIRESLSREERKNTARTTRVAGCATACIVMESAVEDKTKTTPEREALKALVEKLDECLPHINSVFSFAHIHGQRYSGPTFRDELEEARRVLNEKN